MNGATISLRLIDRRREYIVHILYYSSIFSLVVDACVDDLNRYRTLHRNTPDAAPDATLMTHAQTWADYLAKRGTFEHEQKYKEGANIAMLTANDAIVACKSANRMWLVFFVAYIHVFFYKQPHFWVDLLLIFEGR